MDFDFDTSLDLHIPPLKVPGCEYPKPSQISFRVPKVEAHGKFPHYIKTLHDLTSSPETDDFIRWAGNGVYMYVVDAERFCHELEQGGYFRSSKFASVIRNLNYHRFKKMRFEDLDMNLRIEVDAIAAKNPGTSRHLFYHPNFRSGRLDLLADIKYKTQVHNDAHLPNGSSDSDTPRIKVQPVKPNLEAENAYLKRILDEKQSEIDMLRNQLNLAMGNPNPLDVPSMKRLRTAVVAHNAPFGAEDENSAEFQTDSKIYLDGLLETLLD